MLILEILKWGLWDVFAVCLPVYCRTLFQDPGDAPSCSDVDGVIIISRELKSKKLVWHNVNTEFRENLSTDSNLKARHKEEGDHLSLYSFFKKEKQNKNILYNPSVSWITILSRVWSVTIDGVGFVHRIYWTPTKSQLQVTIALSLIHTLCSSLEHTLKSSQSSVFSTVFC
jgi:hypothetical protein